jgi:imidazolonepropionase-like amidohydrolase
MASKQEKTIVIQNGTLIDASGNPAVRNDSIVVKGARIRSVGPVPADVNLEDTENVQFIDATGQTIMPGLMDAHCHMSYGELRSEEEYHGYTNPEFSAIRAIWNAQKVLRAGVTSIISPGGTFFVDVAVRDAITSGMFEGPRIFAAGRYLTTYGSIADFYPTWLEVKESALGISVNTKEEMVTEVRKQTRNGVNLIKVGDSFFGDFQAISTEELTAIVDEAHRRNTKVTIHAPGSGAVRASVEAGIDWIIHAYRATESDLEAVAAAGTPIVPTLAMIYNQIDYGDEIGITPAARDGLKRFQQGAIHLLERLRALDITVMSGTESGFVLTPYGEWHARDMEIMVKDGGYTPMEAIMSATSNIGQATGMDVGVIEPGKLADIIIWNGDPLSDITVLQDRKKLTTVMKGGELVDMDSPWPQRNEMGYERVRVTADKNLLWEDTRLQEPGPAQ